jgi:Protein of unknown function (DUF3800)
VLCGGSQMVKWALYLDETGTPGPHTIPLLQGITPAFTLGGVVLPIERWRDYDRAYLYLKRQFFSAEIDRSSKLDCVWEVKGSDLLAPRNAGSERNKVFCYSVIDLLKEFGGKALGVTFLKSVKSPIPKNSIYTKGLQILAERYDAFLRENDSSGTLILDSRMAHMRKGSGLDYTVATSYLSFVFGNKEGQQLKRIVEAPLFADSGLTAGLQIADIISALIYTNAYREKLAPDGADVEFGYLDYGHTRRFYKPFREIIFESAKPHGGNQLFGLRTIDHRDGPVPINKLLILKQRFSSQSA